jgi:hypothetical protein
MQEILDSLLSAALVQPLHTADDVLAEAHENLFLLAPTKAELAFLTAPVIEEWLQAVLAGKRRQLRAQRGSHYPMQFYCWHDAQATQLRFSLVSAAAALPFGCALRLVDLSVIVQEFLAQEYLAFGENLFDANEVTASWAAAAEAAATQEYILHIWRAIIP